MESQLSACNYHILSHSLLSLPWQEGTATSNLSAVDGCLGQILHLISTGTDRCDQVSKPDLELLQAWPFHDHPARYREQVASRYAVRQTYAMKQPSLPYTKSHLRGRQKFLDFSYKKGDESPKRKQKNALKTATYQPLCWCNLYFIEFSDSLVCTYCSCFIQWVKKQDN